VPPRAADIIRGNYVYLQLPDDRLPATLDEGCVSFVFLLKKKP